MPKLYAKMLDIKNGGLYHLDQISLTDEKIDDCTIQKEIVLNGITYVVKE